MRTIFPRIVTRVKALSDIVTRHCLPQSGIEDDEPAYALVSKLGLPESEKIECGSFRSSCFPDVQCREETDVGARKGACLRGEDKYCFVSYLMLAHEKKNKKIASYGEQIKEYHEDYFSENCSTMDDVHSLTMSLLLKPYYQDFWARQVACVFPFISGASDCCKSTTSVGVNSTKYLYKKIRRTVVLFR